MLNKKLVAKDTRIQREFKQNDSSVSKKSNLNFVIREFDFTTEKIAEMEEIQSKRHANMINVVNDLDAAEKEYKIKIKKWKNDIGMDKKTFEKLLKAYMSNGDKLDGLKLDFIDTENNPELDEEQIQKQKDQEDLKKQMRHCNLQINRLQCELIQKPVHIVACNPTTNSCHICKTAKNNITEKVLIEERDKHMNEIDSKLKKQKQIFDFVEELTKTEKVVKDTKPDKKKENTDLEVVDKKTTEMQKSENLIKSPSNEKENKPKEKKEVKPKVRLTILFIEEAVPRAIAAEGTQQHRQDHHAASTEQEQAGQEYRQHA